ncbi:MAG: hypothetical protein Kow0042_00140 [Calditrichia bacterium]
MKSFIIVTLLTGFFLFMNCERFQKNRQPWIPVFEDTHFTYLQTQSQKIQDAMDAIEQSIQSGSSEQAELSLAEARKFIQHLQHYYIPMTEVRQLIYDADRLYYLKRIEDARDKLQQAKSILLQISNPESPGLDRSLSEVVEMIDQLIFVMLNDPLQVPEKFQTLGRRTNIMLLKGDLILSESEFEVDSLKP